MVNDLTGVVKKKKKKPPVEAPAAQASVKGEEGVKGEGKEEIGGVGKGKRKAEDDDGKEAGDKKVKLESTGAGAS